MPLVKTPPHFGQVGFYIMYFCLLDCSTSAYSSPLHPTPTSPQHFNPSPPLIFTFTYSLTQPSSLSPHPTQPFLYIDLNPSISLSSFPLCTTTTRWPSSQGVKNKHHSYSTHSHLLYPDNCCHSLWCCLHCVQLCIQKTKVSIVSVLAY